MTTTNTTTRKARKATPAKADTTPPVTFSVSDAAQIASDGLRAAGRIESAQVARDKAALAFGDMLNTHGLTTDAFRGKAKDGKRPEGVYCAALREEVAMTWLTAKERKVVTSANDKSAGSPHHKATTKVANAVNRFLAHVDRMAKAGKGNGKGSGVTALAEWLDAAFEKATARVKMDKSRTAPTGQNHDAVEAALKAAKAAVLTALAKS
jgi:hypothetical protein